MAGQVLGSIVAIVVLAAVGTVVGVLVSKNNNKSSSTGSSDTSTSSSTSNSSSTSSSSGNDPSVFTKDSNLRKAFYGLAYTPEGSLPDTGCNSTLGEPSFFKALRLWPF